MKITGYVSHSDCSRHDTGWGHPDHQGRLPAVARAVYRDMLTLFEPLLEVEGQPATADDLLLAHTPRYVEQVRRAAAEAGQAGKSLPFAAESVISGPSWDAAVAAVGCALTAVDIVLEGQVRNAFCPVRPPGHEVGSDRPGGFGLFNSVAVAARHLRERRGLERVLIVEWGAHFGHGTAEIVAADPGIRFLSLHQQGPDPSQVPQHGSVRSLRAGTAGAEFLATLRSAMGDALAGFAPEFVLLSVGFDALGSDPLGELDLEPIDFYAATGFLREQADAVCEGRLVTVMEGGYDPSATASAAVQHLRALAGLPSA